ncbi:hypothetical protein PAER4782_33950 (plasmid) [Pseudomonas aeruginosa]|nr:hypothetical protein PAER4782_33950 [Pseudomonas aeruginosa]CAI9912090.1 hypothetical protein PAER4782_33950 [Pseudomonas aeruginosa]
MGCVAGRPLCELARTLQSVVHPDGNFLGLLARSTPGDFITIISRLKAFSVSLKSLHCVFDHLRLNKRFGE